MSNNKNGSLNSIDSAINKYIIGATYYQNTKSNKTIFDKKDYFYNQFKPIDKIIVKPLVNSSYLIMKRLKYKSEIIGFISLLSLLLGSFFYNKKKKNLTYLFLFFSVFISFFDKLYHDELDHKQKNKEMLIVLIKLTLFGIINMIFKLYSSRNNSCKTIKNDLYMLMFFLILIIMLTHFTEKIYNKKKIVSRKLKYIKRINISLISITFLFIMLFSYNFIVDETRKDSFSIFILDENKK